MNKQIKKGNLNFDQSGRAYPDNPQIKENWDCIWENDGRYYELIGDTEHKEWEQVKVEVRELSLEERIQQIPFSEKHTIHERNECIDDLRTLKGDELKSFEQYIKQQCDSIHTPIRAISLTYNNKTIESYE